VPATNGASHGRTDSSSSTTRAPPPPPPPQPPVAAPVVKKDIYRVLYDFDGQNPNEMGIKEGELLEILKKEGNGKFPSSPPNFIAW
jgi:myosin-1